jgi:hypothetical protein
MIARRVALHSVKDRARCVMRPATATLLTACMATAFPFLRFPLGPEIICHQNPLPPFSSFQRRSLSTRRSNGNGSELIQDTDDWHDVLPFEDWTHQSAKITIPARGDQADDMFKRGSFVERLHSTILTLQEMDRTSIWVDVHISRSSLIEEMSTLGFQFHHAQSENAVLNLWLKDSPSLVPDFATHNIGVGGLVINSRNEILCVREFRKNFMPWKIPGGLTELGEHLDEAVVREVFEETGIRTRFRNVVCF